jgi:hypothetical protein
MFTGGDMSAWSKYSRAGRTKWYDRTYGFSQIQQINHYKLPSTQLITRMKIHQPGSQNLAGGDPIFNQGRYVHPNYFSTSCLTHMNKRKTAKIFA